MHTDPRRPVLQYSTFSNQKQVGMWCTKVKRNHIQPARSCTCLPQRIEQRGKSMMTKSQNNLYFLNVAKSSIVFPQLGKIVLCACTARTSWGHSCIALSGQKSQGSRISCCCVQPQQGHNCVAIRHFTAWLQGQMQGRFRWQWQQYAQYPPVTGASRLNSLLSMLCFWSGTSVTDCLCWQGSG